jgi:hypothetical protein
LFGLQTKTRRVVSSMASASAARSCVSAGPPGRPGTSGTWIERAPATEASSGYISNDRQANAMLVPGSLYDCASCWHSITAPQPVTTRAGSTP